MKFLTRKVVLFVNRINGGILLLLSKLYYYCANTDSQKTYINYKRRRHDPS